MRLLLKVALVVVICSANRVAQAMNPASDARADRLNARNEAIKKRHVRINALFGLGFMSVISVCNLSVFFVSKEKGIDWAKTFSPVYSLAAVGSLDSYFYNNGQGGCSQAWNWLKSLDNG